MLFLTCLNLQNYFQQTWVFGSNVLFAVRRRRRSVFTKIVDNVFLVIRKDVKTKSPKRSSWNRRSTGDNGFNRLETKIDDMRRSQEEFQRLLADRLTRLENKVDLINKELVDIRKQPDEMEMLEDRMVQLFIKLEEVRSVTDNVRRISLHNTMITTSVAEKSGVTKDEISTLIGA